jgi:hypothetical protein
MAQHTASSFDPTLDLPFPPQGASAVLPPPGFTLTGPLHFPPNDDSDPHPALRPLSNAQVTFLRDYDLLRVAEFADELRSNPHFVFIYRPCDRFADGHISVTVSDDTIRTPALPNNFTSEEQYISFLTSFVINLYSMQLRMYFDSLPIEGEPQVLAAALSNIAATTASLASTANALASPEFLRTTNAFTTKLDQISAAFQAVTLAAEQFANAGAILLSKLLDLLVIIYDIFVAFASSHIALSLPSLVFRILNLIGIPGILLSRLIAWLTGLPSFTLSIQIQQTDASIQGQPQARDRPPTEQKAHTLTSLFVGLTGAAITGQLPSPEEVREANGIFQLRRSVRETMKDTFSDARAFFAWACENLPACVSAWLIRLSPIQALRNSLIENGPLRDLIYEISSYNNILSEQRVAYDTQFRNHVFELHDRYVQSCVELGLAKLPPARLSALHEVSKVIDNLYHIGDMSRTCPVFRKEPLVICLFGKPGIGKSVLGPVLCQDLTPSEFLNNCVYVRNPSIRYFETYTGQYITYYDDAALFNDMPQDGTGDFSEILAMKSSATLELDCAFNQKGKKFFNSRMLICNTNQAYWSPKGLVDELAINRRRDILVSVRILDTHALPDGRVNIAAIDSTSIESSFAHYRFDLCHPVDKTRGPQNPLQRDLTYPQLLEHLVSSYKTHYTNETRKLHTYESNLRDRLAQPTFTQADLDALVPPETFPAPTVEFRPVKPTIASLRTYAEALVGVKRAEPQGLGDYLFSVLPGFQARTPYAARAHAPRFLEEHQVVPPDLDFRFTRYAIRNLHPNTLRTVEDIALARASVIETRDTLHERPFESDRSRAIAEQLCGDLLAHLDEDLQKLAARNPFVAAYLNKKAILLAFCGIAGVAFGAYFTKKVLTKSDDDSDPDCDHHFVHEDFEGEPLDDWNCEFCGMFASSDFFAKRWNQSRAAHAQAIIPSGANVDRKRAKAAKTIRGKTPRPLTRRPGFAATAQALDFEVQDNSLDVLLEHRVQPAMCSLYIRDASGTWVHRLSCFFFCGKAFIAPSHFMLMSGRVLSNGDHFMIVTPTGCPYVEVFEDRRLVVFDTHDTCIYLCSNHVRSFKDNIRHFIVDEDLVHHHNIRAVLQLFKPAAMRYANDEEILTAFPGTYTTREIPQAKQLIVRDDEPATVAWDLGQEQQPDGTYVTYRHYLAEAWQYTAPTFKGDCGALLCINDTHSVRKLCGMHVGAAPAHSLYFSEIITQEFLIAGLEEVLEREGNSDIHNVIDLPGRLLAEEGGAAVHNAKVPVPGGAFELVGTIQSGYENRMVGGTKICPSPLYGLIFEPTTAPAVLSQADYRMTNEDRAIAHRNIEKYGKIPIPFPLELYSAVHSSMLEEVDSWNPTGPRRAFTIDEAIAGIHDAEHHDSVNPQTSAGFPYAKWKLFGTKGKETYIHFDEETELWTLRDDNEPARQLRVDVEELISLARQSTRFPSNWTPTLKDERRTHDKIAAGKTRIFTMGNFAYTLAFRMYCHAFAAAFYKSWFHSFSAVSIDPYSAEWTHLVHQLQRVSSFGFAGDYSNYDGSIPPQMHQSLCEATNRWYNDTPEDHQIRAVLFDEACHCIHLLGDVVYATTHGNPSGFPWTVILNTWAGEFFLRIAWLDNAPVELRNIVAYKEHVASKIYGDDNIVAVSPEALRFFNLLTVSKTLARYNITYTMPDKVSLPRPYAELTDWTFLKNGFKRHGAQWYATLDRNTIQELTNWIHRTDEPLEQCVCNCQVALRMAYFHGRTYFDDLRKRIRTAFLSIDHNPTLFTYDEVALDIAVKNGKMRERWAILPLAEGEAQGTEARIPTGLSDTGKIDCSALSVASRANQDYEVMIRSDLGNSWKKDLTRRRAIARPDTAPDKPLPVLRTLIGMPRIKSHGVHDAQMAQQTESTPNFRKLHAHRMLVRERQACARWRQYFTARDRFTILTAYCAIACCNPAIGLFVPFVIHLMYNVLDGAAIPIEFGEPQGDDTADTTQEPLIVTATDPLAAASGTGAVGDIVTLAVASNSGTSLPLGGAPVAAEQPWSYEMAVGRDNLFASISWPTTVTTPLTIINSFHLPADALSNSLNTHPFENYQTWKGDIKLKFRVTGNEYYYGKLYVGAIPFDVTQTTNLSSKSSLLQYDHVLLDASESSEVELMLNYTSIVDLMLTQPLDPSTQIGHVGTPTWGAFMSQMYTIYIMTWEPLQIVSGTATKVTVNCFMSLMNARFECPAPQAATSGYALTRFVKREGYGVDRIERRIREDRQRADEELRRALERDVVLGETQGNTTSNINIDHVNGSSIPVKTEGSSIVPTLSATVPMPPVMDAPNYTAWVPRAIRNAFYNMANVSGIVSMDRLSSYPFSQSLSTPQIIETSEDEMTWESLCSRFSWVEDFYITSTNNVNDILTQGVIAPCESLISDPPTVGGAGSLLNFSIMDNYAFLHHYWSGDIRYRLTVIMTGYHSVNLRICAHYYQTSVPASLEDATNQYYKDIQFDGRKGTRVVTFRFPFMSLTRGWKRVPTGGTTSTDIIECGCGVWSIRMNSALTYTDQVPSTIRCYLEQSGHNMRFYGLNSRSSCITAGYSNPPYSIIGEAQAGEIDLIIAPDSTARPPAANEIVSEVSRNLADVLRRPCPFIEHTFPQVIPTPTNYGELVSYVSFHHHPFADIYFTGGNLIPNPVNQRGTTANFNAFPYTKIDILERDALSAEALCWQYWRGAIRYTIEILSPAGYAGSAATTYAQNGFVAAEVEYVPLDFHDGTGNTSYRSFEADRGTMIQYHGERQMMKGGSAYLCPGTTGRVPNPAKLVLTSQNPTGQIEVPFDGIYTKRFVKTPNGYNGLPSGSYCNASGEFCGDILVRIRQMVPNITVSGSLVPLKIRIHRAAGDDFRFIRYLARPPVYWNLAKVTDVVAGTTWDYQLFPSCLINTTTGWRQPGTARNRMKPQSAIDPKRRPRRRVVVEVDESDSEISILNGEAQANEALFANNPLPLLPVGGTFNGISIAEGSFAYFIYEVAANRTNLTSVPCGLPVPAFVIDVRNQGKVASATSIYPVGTRLVTHSYTLSIREHEAKFSVDFPHYILHNGEAQRIMDFVLLDMLTWASVHSNGPQDIHSQLNAWFITNAAAIENKPAFSVLNEIQQQVSGLEIIVSESPPEGPQHALQHPVAVTVRCVDKPEIQWNGRASTGSKHASKRDAALIALNKMKPPIA